MRRAMSWVYCPPKSRIPILSISATTGSRRGGRRRGRPWPPPPSTRRPPLLGALEDLAFGLDRGRDDQLGLLEVADRHRPDRPHARADRPHEIERAVLGERGAEEDLLERSGDADADARPARQVRVGGGHAP